MKTTAIRINGRIERIVLNDDRDVERIVKRHTAFGSFTDLVNAKGGYRPSVYLGGKSKQAKRELITLVERYDSFQQANNDPRRAYRADFEEAA